MSKIEHIEGKNSPSLEKVYKLNGKEAKQYTKENTKYSHSWQKAKFNEVKNICTTLVDQNEDFREALKATGDKKILHTVEDTYWGTGGDNKSHGRNIYGNILMQIRYEKFGSQKKTKEEIESDEKDNKFAVNISNDTESIVIVDSQGAHIDKRFIFGKSKTYIQKCSTASHMKNFTSELVNGPIRPKVKNIAINNGINDVRNGMSHTEIERLQKECINDLKQVFPNAHIYYNLPVTRSQDKTIELLGQSMWQFCTNMNATFIKHNIERRKFKDEYHLTIEGTRDFVKNLHNYARDNQTMTPDGSNYHRQDNRKFPPRGKYMYNQYRAHDEYQYRTQDEYPPFYGGRNQGYPVYNQNRFDALTW